MKPLLIATLLALGFVSPLAAETAAPSTDVPSAAPAPEPSSDPKLERQRNSAAKLAGMVRFVDASCPEAKPDYDKFKGVIAAMGVDIKDLENGELMMRSLRYTEAYGKETADSCKRALEHFGEAGTTIPNLIVRKAP